MTIKKTAYVKKTASRVDDASQRNKDLATIHIISSKLNMSRDEYEDLLFSIAQVRSASDLNSEKRKQVLNHLNSLQKIIYKGAGVGVPHSNAVFPIHHAVLAKWSEMFGENIVRSNAQSALNAYVRRIFKVDSLRFTSEAQASTVLESLKQWQKRETKQKNETR